VSNRESAQVARRCGTGVARGILFLISRRPLLIARSYRDRVTLRLVNRHISNCHVEAVGVISVSVTLPHPLGTRDLVQALTGKPIKYHIGHF
jgi:hypothetical protein